MTVVTDQRMTLKEFLTYDDGTNKRYELEDGVLVEMGAESTGNTSIGMLLIFVFGALGIPYYRIANKHAIEVRGNHANSRYPDLIIHSLESFAAIEGRSEACIELTDPNPMLAIEIVSPGSESRSNYKRDYQYKPDEYSDRGIAEFWQIDPKRDWVKVGTLTDGVYQFTTFKGNDAIISPTFSDLKLTAAQILRA